MENNTYQNMIVLSFGVYFGWLLSFPFHGPVLLSFIREYSLAENNLPLIFVFFHAISFIIGGIFLKNIYLWRKLMLTGLIASLVVNILFIFIGYSLFGVIGIGILAVSSSLFILGWSCIYSMFIPSEVRIKKMALIMIISNVIYIVINWFSTFLSPLALLVTAIFPLLFTLIVLMKIPESLKLELKPDKKDLLPLPVPLILIFCLFVAGLFLNGGFMYNVMIPSFEEGLPFYDSYKYLPYILVLLMMYKYSEKVQHYLPVYMAVTLLGMAFVSFALLGENILGLFITSTLVESSFSFLDLFVWVAIGNLAFIYRAPYQFFGYVTGVMVFSILSGNIIGSQIVQIWEAHRLVLAIFAAAAIFLTHLVIPWLNQKMNKDFVEVVEIAIEDNGPVEEDEVFKTLLEQLIPGENLTPREKEVTRLILKGLKNKEIAEQLFISDNTLKSHLKNIYSKFGVTQKRELLSIALNIKKITNT